MNTSQFDALLPTFELVLGPDAARQMYADEEFWDSIGTHVLDVQLSRLADFYGKSNATQRRTLRRALNPAASWNLVAYVRRMALRILETEDPRWLVSAFNIASLENATIDFRDSIVSLVIARAAAESVSIDPLPHFAKAISQCDSEMVSTFTNARDHRPSDVRDILREFGPPQLKPKRKRS
jgi:predicted RNA-binding Zn ribbon-like protein